MHILNMTHTHQISGGLYSHTCYEAYKAIAEDNQMSLGQAAAIIFTGGLGLIGVVGYKMGLRDAAKSVCGNAFDETEMVYCASHPKTCLKPEEKQKA